MPLDVGPSPRVDPPAIPASGGTVRVVFDAAAIDDDTRLKAEYHIEDEPYVFVDTADPKVAIGRVERVRVSGGDFPIRLTLRKSPPSAPKHMSVSIRLRIFEVDASGDPVTLPSGRTKAPTRRTAVVTIE